MDHFSFSLKSSGLLLSTDFATDIVGDSEDSHFPDIVHCDTADAVFEDHACVTASIFTNSDNDDFIDLASQVVGNSPIATDGSLVDTGFNTAYLQDNNCVTANAD